MLIGVVIVTYNRLEKLKKCLASYENQSLVPDKILVIDNASNDGTKEFLDQWMGRREGTIEKMIVHSPENKGGAGGFSEGIRLMAGAGVDWIWAADDDAYLMPQCLEKIHSFYCSQTGEAKDRIVAMSAKVVGRDGMVSPLHRRKIRRSAFRIQEQPLEEHELAGPVEIDLFSFVGVAIRSTAVKEVGIPDSGYFIYFDDSEYALRIGRLGTCLCFSDAVILHDSGEGEGVRYSWKNYYMFRNKLYTYKKYFPVRYCCTEVCMTAFMVLRNYNCLATWRQFGQAVLDAWRGKMGVNTRYLP